MSNCYLINATKIEAYWAHEMLLIRATGHSECPQNVHLSVAPMTIYPPEYQLMTCTCPAIGFFPYNVSQWFPMPELIRSITVHTAKGPQQVDVHPFPKAIDSTPTPSVLAAEPAKDEVIGISPNSFDVNAAIADAARKLQKLYPANVNATVVETGIVATGTPIGIAFLYVRMKQQKTAAPKDK